MGKKPAPECGGLEAAIKLRCVALAYIQETRTLLELLKTNALSEDGSKAFDVALSSLKDLQPTSQTIYLTFRTTGFGYSVSAPSNAPRVSMPKEETPSDPTKFF